MPVRRHQKRIQAVCHRRATCRFDEGSRGHEHSSVRDPPCHAWWLGTGISIYSNRLPGLCPPRSPGWKKPCKREPTSITTNTHGTGRPTGSKRFHSDFTPMFQLWYDRRAVNGANRSGRPGTHALIPARSIGCYVPYLVNVARCHPLQCVLDLPKGTCYPNKCVSWHEYIDTINSSSLPSIWLSTWILGVCGEF